MGFEKASLHDITIVEQDGSIVLYKDVLRSKYYVVEIDSEHVCLQWTVQIDNLSAIPDDVWLELKKKIDRIHFDTTFKVYTADK